MSRLTWDDAKVLRDGDLQPLLHGEGETAADAQWRAAKRAEAEELEADAKHHREEARYHEEEARYHEEEAYEEYARAARLEEQAAAIRAELGE